MAAGLLGVLVSRSARAQSARDCEFGWVNGLLVVGGEQCDLSGVPSHLASGFSVADTGDTSTTDGPLTAEERRLRRREHHQQKKNNNRCHKREKRNRKQNHQQDVRERKIYCDDFRDQKEAIEWLAQHPEDADHIDPDGDGKACEITCAEFSDQKEAIEWIAQHPGDRPVLDPDNDGVACEQLDTVRCNDFDRRPDVVAWLEQHGWTVANNPFNLHENGDGLVCENLPVSCDDFATQAEAQNWWDEFGEKGDELDPNNNDVPCEHLP